MKIDPGTLVYIFIALIFAVLGAAGKKKKPVVTNPKLDQEDSGTVEQEEQSDVLAENLRRFMGNFGNYGMNEVIAEEEEVEPEISVMKSTESKKAADTAFDRHDTVEGAIDSANAESAYAFVSDTIKRGEFAAYQMDADLDHDMDGFLLNFDIRKAIIYSEIINPKYF